MFILISNANFPKKIIISKIAPQYIYLIVN